MNIIHTTEYMFVNIRKYKPFYSNESNNCIGDLNTWRLILQPYTNLTCKHMRVRRVKLSAAETISPQEGSATHMNEKK